jgi:hypothetical protein
MESTLIDSIHEFGIRDLNGGDFVSRSVSHYAVLSLTKVNAVRCLLVFALLASICCLYLTLMLQLHLHGAFLMGWCLQLSHHSFEIQLSMIRVHLHHWPQNETHTTRCYFPGLGGVAPRIGRSAITTTPQLSTPCMEGNPVYNVECAIKSRDA